MPGPWGPLWRLELQVAGKTAGGAVVRCGDQRSQSISVRPSTRLNSRVLSVTSTAFSPWVWAAIHHQ